MPYLTADAQDLLFERVRSLSAPGSRVAVEAFTNEFFSPDSAARREEQTELYRDVAIKLGGKDITESGNLLYEEQRTEVVDWLQAHGWTVTAATSADHPPTVSRHSRDRHSRNRAHDGSQRAT